MSMLEGNGLPSASPNGSSSKANESSNNQPDNNNSHMMRYLSRSGQMFTFDTSRKACEPFGFYFGDRVQTAKKKKLAWVIGVCCQPADRQDLWFHIDGETGASRWEGFGQAEFEKNNFKLICRPGEEEREAERAKHEEQKKRYNAPELGQLLQDDLFYDVSFEVGESETVIKAHRAILCARSQYFRSMFTNGMKESNQSVIKIPDIEENSFRGVLEFLYTGNLDMKKYDIVNLLITASQLQLDSLSQLCYSQLKDDRLTAENVDKLLHVSKTYQLTDLRKRCRDYILDNFKDLLALGRFKVLMTEHPDEMEEVLSYLEPRKNDNRETSDSGKKRKIIMKT